MTTIFPGGSTGGGSTGGGGGSTGGEDVLGAMPGARRPKGQKTTSTQQAAQEANVPDSGAASTTVGTTGSDTNRKRKRNRDTVLTGSTGTSEEQNTYKPSIGGP